MAINRLTMTSTWKSWINHSSTHFRFYAFRVLSTGLYKAFFKICQKYRWCISASTNQNPQKSVLAWEKPHISQPRIYSIEFHLMALIDQVQAPHKNAFHEIQNVCFLLTLVIIIVCPQNDGLFCLKLSGRCLKSDGLPASNVTPWQRSEQKGWKKLSIEIVLCCFVFFLHHLFTAFAKVEMAWN